MEYVLGYILFATTTAFVAIYELLHPVVLLRQSEDPPADNIPLVYATFFLLSILAAPAIILSCLIPEWGIRFREALKKSLFD
jgi:hypothetical protein